MAGSSSGESRDLIGQDWLVLLSLVGRQNPAYSPTGLPPPAALPFPVFRGLAALGGEEPLGSPSGSAESP